LVLLAQTLSHRNPPTGIGQARILGNQQTLEWDESFPGGSSFPDFVPGSYPVQRGLDMVHVRDVLLAYYPVRRRASQAAACLSFLGILADDKPFVR
jgi:hypothetical protein